LVGSLESAADLIELGFQIRFKLKVKHLLEHYGNLSARFLIFFVLVLPEVRKAAMQKAFVMLAKRWRT
jgi:hypothetical protein